MLAGAAVICGRTGAGGSVPRFVHLHGCWQEALVTLHEDLSAGQPELCRAVVAGVPESKQSKRPEQTLPGPL